MQVWLDGCLGCPECPECPEWEQAALPVLEDLLACLECRGWVQAV